MASFIVCTDKHDLLNSFNSLSIKQWPCVRSSLLSQICGQSLPDYTRQQQQQRELGDKKEIKTKYLKFLTSFSVQL